MGSTGIVVDNILTSQIELTAEITAAGQTVTVNKYFANAHTIDRGDGTASADLTADTTYTYSSP